MTGAARITAGYRCPLQPVGDPCFSKHVNVNGSFMTFREAMLHGFLRWDHAALLRKTGRSDEAGKMEARAKA